MCPLEALAAAAAIRVFCVKGSILPLRQNNYKVIEFSWEEVSHRRRNRWLFVLPSIEVVYNPVGLIL